VGSGGLAEGTSTTDVTDTLQSVTDPVLTTSDPVQPVTDTLQSVTDPVLTTSDPVQPVTDTLQSVTDPVLTTSDPVQVVADTLQSATDPVQLIADTLQAATDTLPSVVTDPVLTSDPVQPVTDTLQSVADPMLTTTDPVQPVTDLAQPMRDTLQSVADPVQVITDPVQTDPVQTVTETVQPVADAVQTDPVQTVTETVQPVADAVQPVTDAVQPVADAVQPVADATASAVGTAAQTAESLTDASMVGATVEKTAGQATEALFGAGEPIDGAVAQVTDEDGALSDKISTMLAGTGGPDAAAGIQADIPSHLAENITPSGTGIADVVEPASGNGGMFDALPFEGPGLIAGADEALILSVGILTAARIAFAVRAGGPSAVATTQFFLANARQIPAYCGGLQGTVNRQVSAAVAGTIRLSGPGFSAASPTKAIEAAEDFTQAIRDGFLRGTGRPGTVNGTADDGTSDTRLLIQLGMLLGTVYLAFLTVWFWATRLRWNPRM
jgi:uncharacterized protein YoxC